MPQIYAVYVAFAAVGGTAFGVAVAVAVAVVTYAPLVAFVAYSASQSRKMKKALSNALGSQGAAIDQGRKVMARDPISPRRTIYGQIPVSGPIVLMEVSGTENEYLNLCIVLAAHECEELGEIKFEDVTIPLDGSGNATGTYAGYVRIKKFVGVAAGARDTTWESELPGIWTSAHLGKSVSRLHVQLKHNPELFVNGIPTITCLVKGKKVYDPRTATTVWSDNSALCIGDFLMDAKFGKGIALARIRSADWIEAANICDESIVLADASTEARYTCNGALTADQDPSSTLLDILSSMAGHVTDAGGLWTIRAGAHRTPTVTLTDSDICGSFTVVPRQSRQDTYNGVKGTFISEINQWAPADFPAVKNDTYKTWDGEIRLWKDVAYNFTTSAATAQRLAKIDLEVGRQQIVINSEYMLKALQLQPGDVVEVTRARMGWSAKQFIVDSWAFKLGQAGGGPSLSIALTMRETAEGVWDWADGAETTVDLAPNTTLTDPRSVVAPTNVVLTDDSALQPDGSTMPRLKVVWDVATDVNVSRGGFVRIEYKKHADSTWLDWSTIPGDRTEDYILDILGGVQYDVRVRFRNLYGVHSAYTSATTGGGGVTVPPGSGAVLGTAGGSATVSGTSPQLITPLQVTATLAAGTHIITFSGYVVNSAGSPNDITAHIYRGGTSIASVTFSAIPLGTAMPCTLIKDDAPGAGSYTYSVRLQGSNTNNMVGAGSLIVS